ncbi:MAG: hypothetical protein KME06_16150 [Kastovskya adunca ATA6-11-RM4]|jgi:phosphate uptake regulator|nr:hypothetical protein [Kastovskya adunca ATA6-11-RM4]
MFFLRRNAVIFPAAAALSVLILGCSESKTAQCSRIIEVANQAVTKTKSVTNGGQTSDPKAMLQAADSMEQASKEMESLELTDAKLKDYQAGFINMYRDTSKATRNFIAAFEKKDRPAAEKALSNLQQATTPEKQLVTDINTYCAGS